MERVIDKVALVSGGAGIGAAVATRLHGEGARVIVGDVTDSEGSEIAARLGSGARYVHLDVTSPGTGKVPCWPLLRNSVD